MMRLFVAVFPPEEAIAHLTTALSTTDIRLPATERLHLTLAFLGDVPDPAPAIAALDDALAFEHRIDSRSASKPAPADSLATPRLGGPTRVTQSTDAAGAAQPGDSPDVAQPGSTSQPDGDQTPAAQAGGSGGAAQSGEPAGGQGGPRSDHGAPESGADTLGAHTSGGDSTGAAAGRSSMPGPGSPAQPSGAAESGGAAQLASAPGPGGSGELSDTGQAGGVAAARLGGRRARQQAASTVDRGKPLGEFVISGGGRFGSILWAGVSGDLTGLAKLTKRVRQNLRAHRLKPDDKQFRPHLTIARRLSREQMAAGLGVLRDYEGPAWQVREIVLVHSVLGARPVYHRLMAWHL